MNTYRYNPVFNQWVLLGSPTSTMMEITDRNLLDIGRTKDFVAASVPRQPFIIDPPSARHTEHDLLYQPQPPVGEAEVLLYAGDVPFKEWKTAEWGAWLSILQQRIRQAYQNPYVHFAQFTFSTGLLKTVGTTYQRVGDLTVTSHPIAGTPVPLQEELVQKLREKENAFIVLHNDSGDLYVPSAPLYEKEVWFLPKTMRAAFDEIEADERGDIAKLLAALFHSLNTEFEATDFTVTLHTSIAGLSEESTWWLQFHEQVRQTMSSYPVRPLPEAFARHLEYALSTHSK